jgi:hypothetical protein
MVIGKNGVVLRGREGRGARELKYQGGGGGAHRPPTSVGTPPPRAEYLADARPPVLIPTFAHSPNIHFSLTLHTDDFANAERRANKDTQRDKKERAREREGKRERQPAPRMFSSWSSSKKDLQPPSTPDYDGLVQQLIDKLRQDGGDHAGELLVAGEL